MSILSIATVKAIQRRLQQTLLASSSSISFEELETLVHKAVREETQAIWDQVLDMQRKQEMLREEQEMLREEYQDIANHVEKIVQWQQMASELCRATWRIMEQYDEEKDGEEQYDEEQQDDLTKQEI